VNHTLSLSILAFEKNRVSLRRTIRWGNTNRIPQEVANVSAKPQEGFIGGIFSLLEVF
jgi:hypothetical protein